MISPQYTIKFLRHRFIEQFKIRYKIQWQEILFLLLPTEYVCLKITNLSILYTAFVAKYYRKLHLSNDYLNFAFLMGKSYIHALILNEISINIHPKTIYFVFSSFNIQLIYDKSMVSYGRFLITMKLINILTLVFFQLMIY